MKQHIIVKEYSGKGLGGEQVCGEFMVSLLNFLPRLVPEKVADMQKHTETDECFILLSGQAMLYTADGEDAPDHIELVNLENGKIYTVPMNIWHAPVLSEDAKILLVEKSNTVAENSPRYPLNAKQIDTVRNLGMSFNSAKL